MSRVHVFALGLLVGGCAGGSGTRFDNPDAGTEQDLTLGCPAQSRSVVLPLPSGASLRSADVRGTQTLVLYTEGREETARSTIASVGANGTLAPLHVADGVTWSTFKAYEGGLLASTAAGSVWLPDEGPSTQVGDDDWVAEGVWLAVRDGELLQMGRRESDDYPTLLALPLSGEGPARDIRRVFDNSRAVAVTDAGLWMWRESGAQVLQFPLSGTAPGTPLARDCAQVAVSGNRFACSGRHGVSLYEAADGEAVELNAYELPEGATVLALRYDGGHVWFVEKTKDGTQRLLRMNEQESRVVACGVTPNLRGIGRDAVVTLGSGGTLYVVDL